jgi:HTH-type transcriptional regulator/antitoxin MqsA
MQCLVCGGAEAIHDTRDVPYTYRGEEAVLPAIEGDFCPTCGEIVLDRENSVRASSLAGEFRIKMNGSDRFAHRFTGV